MYRVEFVGDKSLCTTPTEVRDKLTGESGAKQITSNPNNCSRVEHGIDATFAMIAHD